MPVPRAHATKGHQGRRRSHLALKPLALSACGHCKKAKLPHVMCPHCGYYGGREVVNFIEKGLKKQEKRKQKAK